MNEDMLATTAARAIRIELSKTTMSNLPFESVSSSEHFLYVCSSGIELLYKNSGAQHH